MRPRMAATPWDKLQTLDGRWITAILVVAYFAVMLLLPRLAHLSHDRVWNMTGVAAMPTPFVDLGVVVDGSAAYRQQGAAWTEGTVAGYGYNYPHIWLYSNYLGLNERTLDYFGVALGLAFYAAALVMLGPLTWAEGGLATLCLLSPPVLLAVERGNIDLVVFVLLTIAVCFHRTKPVTALLCVVAGVLKVFPAFGLLALVGRPWKKAALWVGSACGLLLVYFLTRLPELHEIANATPHKSRLSYGACAVFIGLFSLAGPTDLHPTVLTATTYLKGYLLLGAVVALAVGFRPRGILGRTDADATREEFAFKLGAGLFLGTYLLGTNYDYRLCILLFCLPLLFHARRAATGALTKWAGTAVIILLIYLNWYRFSQETELREFLIKQALSWTLLACLTGILATLLFPKRAG